MIKSLHIENFQSHKDTDLEFDSGVNVIIGPSDSGKSAVLRALNWVINNQPSGDGFRSDWGGDAIVDLELDDGYEISREKGKENLYVLSKKVSRNRLTKPIEFKAFGRDVPEQIKFLLNFSEINIQEQHDHRKKGPLFLLSANSGEVAKYLNQIVNLEKIDSSLINIARILREEDKCRKQSEHYCLELNAQIIKFDWLSEAEENLVGLEKLKDSIIRAQNRSAKLSKIISQIERIKSNIQRRLPIILLKKEQIKLSNLKLKIDEFHTRRENLSLLCKKIKACQFKLQTHRQIVQLKPELNNLLKLNDKIDKQTENANALESLINNIKELKDRINITKQTLNKNKKEFDKLMPDRCPLCSQIIHKYK